MGLRLSESLALQVGDIDGKRKQVHIRRGKGHKDCFFPLPNKTYEALRALWCKHRNPCWLFPSTVGSPERIRKATKHMDRGGTQAPIHFGFFSYWRRPYIIRSEDARSIYISL